MSPSTASPLPPEPELAQRLRAALETSRDSYIALQARFNSTGEVDDFIFLDLNAAAERQSGLTRDQLIGRRVTELFPGSHSPDHFGKFVQVFISGEPIIDQIQYRVTAETGWYRRQIIPLPDGVAIFNFNIRELVETQNALRESEERYRIITESISEIAYSFRVNPDRSIEREWEVGSYERITGYQPEERDALGTLAFFYPEDHALVRQHLDETIDGIASVHDYLVPTRSGAERWVRIHRYPIRDEKDGRIIRFYGVAQDIDAEKRAELAAIEREKLQIALDKERELNSVRINLMRTISHEFRIPLTMIALSLDILERYQRQIPSDQQVQRFAIIREQIAKITSMLDDISLVLRGIDQFIAFRPVPIDLDALCRELIAQFGQTISSHHRITFNAKGSFEDVRLDSALVQRIITNLLTNAIKYSAPDTEIHLELWWEGDKIMLQVTDQGIGIPESDIDRIFDPFHRASNVGEIIGTGLGLNIVRNCVELHNGAITVRSIQGAGTSFIVSFPQKFSSPDDEPVNSAP
jgi:PAS domain S-box-containing protein